jgi:hypothetical protein
MQKLYSSRVTLALLALAVVVGLPVGATTLLQMNLQDLCDRADKVAHVTIVDMDTGFVHVGGADLPTVTYKARVEDPLKGAFAEDKGQLVMEFTMVGTLKEGGLQVGDHRSFATLPHLPNLQVGGEYILMTTPESAVGLSTTVGLGQGAFRVYEESKVEMVVNEFNNNGLFAGMGGTHTSGPLTYDALVDAIRAAVAQ